MEEQLNGEKSAVEAGKHVNDVVVDVDDDPWVEQMEEKLASKFEKCQPSHPFTICKVPRDIRRVDDVAHDPLIVSIGPYHRGNPSLHDMQEVKWRNLKEFHRQARNDFNKYLKAMKQIEQQARACYSGNINMNADEFIEMMLLDGLFIIELFSMRGNSFLLLVLRLLNIKKEEPIYTIRGMLCRVGHDMLLLENQLPFFVLERLWSLTDQRSWFDRWKSACTFILDYSLPFEHDWDFNILQEIFDGEEEEEEENPEMINKDGVHHLLHLVYLLLKPTSLANTKKSKPMEPTTTGSSSESMDPTEKLPTFIKKMKTLSFLPRRCRDCLPSPSGQESQSMECTAKLPAFIQKMKTLSFLPPRCRDCFPSPSGQESQSMDCAAKLPAVIKKILSFLPPRCRDCFPSPSGQESQSMECTAKLPAVIKKILPFLSPEDEPPPLEVIPSAVELDEAGVVFKCVKAKSFLDVKFEQGTMKMPRLSVEDSTKPHLRNFIAYEQCFPNQGDHITSYCSFMDHLVNTPRDVEILKKSKIIENWLGSDEEVALLFNDLGKGIFLSGLKRCYLRKSFEQVMKHTQKTWPKWQAKLNHDYFSNPWAIISLMAAAFVIFLTSVQTYYAVFT